MVRSDIILGESEVARLAKPKRVIVYADQDGNEPFTDWLYFLPETRLDPDHALGARELWRL